MFKNRFLLVLGVLSVVMITMAISRPFAISPAAEKLSWPPRPVIAPAVDANRLSDYYERHPEHNAPAATEGVLDVAGDFYQRHPQWTIALPVTGASEYLDYHQRHSEQRDAGISLSDECFDVSISELAACREASQSVAE
jgi:hypothetical protein